MQDSKTRHANGLLILNKGKGLSSARCGNILKRKLGASKAGHLGTLDPFAEGVLPLAFGRACAALRYMENFKKSYRLRVRFGRSTDSLDPEGKTTDLCHTSCHEFSLFLSDPENKIASVLPRFIGEIFQFPPIFSAVKYKGKKLYEYARSGKTQIPEIKKRRASIYSLKMESCGFDGKDPEAPFYCDLICSCGKGCYMRSLAGDIGCALGLPSYCSDLTRLTEGPFSIENALHLDEISEDTELLPIEAGLSHLTVIKCKADEIDRLLCGLHISAFPYQLTETEDDEKGEKRYLMSSELGTAGVCRLEYLESEPYFVPERMFTDRALYFSKSQDLN